MKTVMIKTGLLTVLLMSLAVSTSAQRGAPAVGGEHKFGVVAKAGVAISTGEFDDLFGNGFAAYIEAPYDLSGAMQLFASVGYTRFAVDNDKLNHELEIAGIPGTADVDAPYTIVPLLAGLKYFSHYGSFWPYFTFTFGLYMQELKTSGTITDGGVTTTLTPTTQSWSQGAFGVGLGTMIELGNRWSLDFDAKFNSVIDYEGRVLIGTSGSENVSTRAIKFASILGGLSYKF